MAVVLPLSVACLPHERREIKKAIGLVPTPCPKWFCQLFRVRNDGGGSLRPVPFCRAQRWTDHKKRLSGKAGDLGGVPRTWAKGALEKKGKTILAKLRDKKGEGTGPAKGTGGATYANKSYN